MPLKQLVTDLAVIAAESVIKEEENRAFVDHLKKLNTVEIDEAIHRLEKVITPKIDCTECGNCCKTLMINVEEKEADIAANHLLMTRTAFDDAYLEKSLSGKMLISKIPCHFLADNKCTIYESRFGGCREFPALHLPNIQKRLFTIFMHYDRCPIIYNVMEELKIITQL